MNSTEQGTDFRPPSREEAIADEYREWFLDRKLGPMDPEVAAILADWDDGGDGLPWSDAGPEDQERTEEEAPRQPGEAA